MNQHLEATITIPIPADSILVKRVEYEQLKKQELSGVYWSMKDLEARTNRKSEWLKEHILYRPRFREKLDAANGGFVYYPRCRGETWSFQAVRMAEFLDRYFGEIFELEGR